MDVYTAFLFGVLVGQWVLLFAIWRANMKLVRLMNSMCISPKFDQNNLSDLVILIEEGDEPDKRLDDWLRRQDGNAKLLRKAGQPGER